MAVQNWTMAASSSTTKMVCFAGCDDATFRVDMVEVLAYGQHTILFSE